MEGLGTRLVQHSITPIPDDPTPSEKLLRSAAGSAGTNFRPTKIFRDPHGGGIDSRRSAALADTVQKARQNKKKTVTIQHDARA